MSQVAPLVGTESLELAEQSALERLLNAYLRENNLPDPRVSPLEPLFYLNLNAAQQVLCGEMTYWSMSGHHTYGSHWWLTSHRGEPLTSTQVIERLLEELAACDHDGVQRSPAVHQLAAHIQNSIHKTQRYIQHYQNRVWPTPDLNFLVSEQSLYFGHPFHPTPKSTEGFSEQDLQCYAPELQAAFVPHFWAIAPELIREDWVNSDPAVQDAVIPEAVRQAARQQLHPQQANYRLLPCHPWQAHDLRQQSLVQQLQQSGQLVDLGPIGDPVMPTASVRTVWQPGHAYFYKLPLNVRITNFIRVNPTEQIQRAVDAGKVITVLGDRIQQANFRILLEVGYRTIQAPQAELAAQQLTERFAVIFREVPSALRADQAYLQAHLFVVAALLEPFPNAQEPKLFQAIRQTNQGQLVDLQDWLRRYLDCSLIPLLSLLAEYGISLEAHVQNSLIQLEHGLPQCFYVRDLEGVSIDRAQAMQHHWFDHVIDETSPVLYHESDTTLRLQYYFLVNHLGHLIATLGRYSEQSEAAYWHIVREVLQAELAVTSSLRLQELIQTLLTQPCLPAKANLLSRFQQRSERPLYVSIPNPIAHC